MGSPRVTLGIATYDRDTYLAEAISSGLAQRYDDFELLVVCDGSRNPRIEAVLEQFAHDPRLRVVRHETNRGIAAAYDTIWQQGRGELIAMLGDDDVCLPDRLARQVAIFDRWPDTGVVHGDALVIDASGAVTGQWNSRDFTQEELVHAFFRAHNFLVDPTRMVHRRVYEAVGGYDGSYPIAQDLHFWLRAARDFRFRHVPGGPLTGFRRHGANTSDESARAQEVADVERALEMAIELYPLRELVPEVRWDALDPREAERQAWLRLAELLERRLLPLPGLAARVRARGEALAAPTAALRVLATPAWGETPPAGAPDPLAELLAQWATATGPGDSASLCLLADPAADGDPAELEARVLGAAAAAGVDLDACADVELKLEPAGPERDARLHAAIPLYVPLHAACGEHERLALASGGEVVALADDGLARRLERGGDPVSGTRDRGGPAGREPSPGPLKSSAAASITGA